MPMSVGLRKFMWEKQPFATINLTPVQNTWYTVLDTTKFVKLIYLVLGQGNAETADKSCQLQVVMDGITHTMPNVSISNNVYKYCYLHPLSDEMRAIDALINAAYYDSWEGHSVKVEARLTSAVGTNQILRSRVQHEILKKV